MDTHILESYRERLLNLGNRLQGDVTGLSREALRTSGADASGGLSNAPLHPADLSSDSYEGEVSRSLLESGGQRLEDVNAALDRINRGTFGTCEECEGEISEERLEAVPYARLCIDCAHANEPSTVSTGSYR